MGNQNDRDFLSFFLLFFFFSRSSAKGRKTKVGEKKEKWPSVLNWFSKGNFFNQLSRPRRDSSQDAVAVVTGMIKAPGPRHAHRQLLMAGEWGGGGGSNDRHVNTKQTAGNLMETLKWAGVGKWAWLP